MVDPDGNVTVTVYVVLLDGVSVIVAVLAPCRFPLEGVLDQTNRVGVTAAPVGDAQATLRLIRVP